MDTTHERWRGGRGGVGAPLIEEVIREDEDTNQLQQLLGSSGKKAASTRIAFCVHTNHGIHEKYNVGLMSHCDLAAGW